MSVCFKKDDRLHIIGGRATETGLIAFALSADLQGEMDGCQGVRGLFISFSPHLPQGNASITVLRELQGYLWDLILESLNLL